MGKDFEVNYIHLYLKFLAFFFLFKVCRTPQKRTPHNIATECSLWDIKAWSVGLQAQREQWHLRSSLAKHTWWTQGWNLNIKNCFQTTLSIRVCFPLSLAVQPKYLLYFRWGTGPTWRKMPALPPEKELLMNRVKQEPCAKNQAYDKSYSETSAS